MNKKALVLGVLLKPNRYSNYVIQRLLANDFKTVAFGLKEGRISGIDVGKELLPCKDIHTVTL